MDGEMGQEGRDLLLPHVARMPFMVKENESADPSHVGIFGTDTVMLGSDLMANLVEKLRRLRIYQVVPSFC